VNPRPLLLVGLAFLLAFCLLPLALFGFASLGGLELRTLERCELADGRVFYGAVLPRGGWDERTGQVRILRGDGEAGPAALSVPVGDLRSRRPAPSAWIVEREDGPDLFGVPVALDGPGGRIARPDSIASLLSTLPSRLRDDRARLARRVREAGDSAAFDAMGEQWRRWLARDDSTLLEVSRADGRILSIRVSGIARVSRAGRAGTVGRVAAAGANLGRFLTTPPGPWGGGGIRPALLSVFQLALFAGLFSGVFGLSAAFWIHSWGRVQGWRGSARALVSHMAGVPGVVWGVVGVGVLVHGLGGRLDLLWPSTGGGVVWGAGGMLWASLTLGAFATPIVLAQALEELDRIPARWSEILWSCGATESQVFRRVLLPNAWKGLVASVLSGMARAAGETAPLFLTGAIHSAGGLLLGGPGLFPGLAGGFLHPGVLALDPPWQGMDAELGQPLVALTLLCLAVFCISLDLAASRLRHRETVDPEVTA